MDGEETMKRAIRYVTGSHGLKELEHLLEQGYVLDPDLKIVRLENSAIYHLIRYEEGEEPVEPVKKGEFDDVVDVKQVSFEEVPSMISQNYRVYNIYAKHVIMIKETKE